MDQLSSNRFFDLLRTQFKSKFSEASEKCHVICVPQTECVRRAIITDEFVDSHILVKSAFYTGEYRLLSSQKMVKIDKNVIRTLRGFSKTKEIRILSREIGYNKKSQQFEILIIESPLCSYKMLQTKRSSIISGFFDKIKSTSDGLTFRKCDNFFHDSQELSAVVTNLDDFLRKFNNNYVVVPNNLDHTARKLREVVNDTTKDLSIVYKQLIDEEYAILSNIQQIAESYIMGEVHDKVFPVVCQRLKTKDQKLAEKLLHLDTMNITVDQLGANELFCLTQSAAVVELAALDSLRTPLEKVNCIRNTIQLITTTIDRYIKDYEPIIKLRTLTMPNITTDDMIAILATVIIKSKLTHLKSNIYYMEHFHWTSSSSDKATFDLVTFQAAGDFIETHDFQKLKPPKIERKKELSLEELMEVTKNVQLQEDARKNSSENENLLTTPISYDRELGKIAKMIEKSTNELREVERLGITDPMRHRRTGSYGKFSSNPSGVTFGKQI